MNKSNVVSLSAWAETRCMAMAGALHYIPCKEMSQGSTVVFYDKEMRKYQSWPNWLLCYRELKKQQLFLQRLEKVKKEM